MYVLTTDNGYMFYMQPGGCFEITAPTDDDILHICGGKDVTLRLIEEFKKFVSDSPKASF